MVHITDGYMTRYSDTIFVEQFRSRWYEDYSTPKIVGTYREGDFFFELIDSIYDYLEALEELKEILS